MSDTHKGLKAQLVEADAKIRGIESKLSKAVQVRNNLLDRLFMAETGFKLGADVIWTPHKGSQKGKSVRAKLVCRDSDGWKGKWWCTVKPYKKDGTLGMNERRICHATEELTQPEKVSDYGRRWRRP